MAIAVFGCFTAPDGVPAPTSALGVAKIGGSSVSASWKQSLGGGVNLIAGTGTATVNPDCTWRTRPDSPGILVAKPWPCNDGRGATAALTAYTAGLP